MNGVNVPSISLSLPPSPSLQVVGIVLGCILLVAVNKAHNYTEV